MKSIQKNLLASYFIIAALALGSSSAYSQVSISIDIAPPPLEVYDQPACPDDGYLWTPGYWAYGDNAYYWVPGAWVQPPEIGDFWTPPYWGWDGSAFEFYAGYWGPNVGYYGGINYGYGYGGNGYGGGRWQGGHFSYNTAVNNVSSTSFHNTYVDRSAINSNTSKVSYNGGKGGVLAKPTAEEKQFSNVRDVQPTSVRQPEATVHSQAPTEQKAEPQQEPAQVQQPEHQEQQPPAEQKAEPQQESAQAQQPEHQEQQPQAEQKAEPQREPAQAQEPEHQQEQAQPKQEAQPQQPAHQQAQAQPSQAAHPASPQTSAKGPAAQPDKKTDNGPNNASNH
jgi:hypothetical protein